MIADVPAPMFVTERGHVCRACNMPIPTGYYRVQRTFDASPVDDPANTITFVVDLHPSCAIIWDLKL